MTDKKKKEKETGALESLYAVLLKKKENHEEITQQEIQEQADRLHLSEDEQESLFEKCQENGITAADDLDEDLEDLYADTPGEESESETEEGPDKEEPESEEETPNPYEEKSRRKHVTSDSVSLYLQEISAVPLLKPEEELRIAKQVQDGEKAKEALKGTSLSAEQKNQYEQQVQEGKEAKNILTSSNLRLVVSIARSYMNRGLGLLDLIQEGNMGLMRAVEKYDYTRGFRFSTYATWWIRQSIVRAISDQSRDIRLPVHMSEQISRVHRTQRQLTQELGRDPTMEEIAAKMEGMTPERVDEILKIAQDPVSLESPAGDEENSVLSDFIEDKRAVSPDQYANNEYLREEVNRILNDLPERERMILRMRFGLDDGKPKTLEEVGQACHVTRERIRQIESQALRRLNRSYARKEEFQDLKQ